MIGHYLLTLSEEQEDRVLTTQFRPLTRPTIGDDVNCHRCLVIAALGRENVDWDNVGTATKLKPGELSNSPGFRYEDLCRRFGTPRVNAAIRNRILSNRARRVLKSQSETAVLVGERTT